MARLRFAVLSYVQLGEPPQVVLARLSRLISIEDVGHFATVVCGTIDLPKQELVVANAGHPPPLLLAPHGVELLSDAVGVPVGVSDRPTYEPTVIRVHPGSTLLAFTDGLIERRNESVDTGLNRLATYVWEHRSLELDDLIRKVVEESAPGGTNDDTAILGIQWQN
jgi:serine phosphatase RsbU (regulator of sigma subunit)